MICRSCGTEIADKAIVCYRCGTATEEPRRRPPARPPGGSGLRLRLARLAAVFVIVPVALLVLPETPEGWPRAVGFATVALVTFLTMRFVRQRWGP